jgi:hypothetical protein
VSVHVLLSSLQEQASGGLVQQSSITDHTAVSVRVMHIIAITIVVCNVIVLLAKGVDAMPFGVFGIIGSAVFLVAALAMAEYVKRQPEH